VQKVGAGFTNKLVTPSLPKLDLHTVSWWRWDAAWLAIHDQQAVFAIESAAFVSWVDIRAMAALQW